MFRSLFEARVSNIRLIICGPTPRISAIGHAPAADLALTGTKESFILAARNLIPADREWPAYLNLLLRTLILGPARLIGRRTDREAAGRNHNHFRAGFAVMKALAGGD
jgi:hypothetical protein